MVRRLACVAVVIAVGWSLGCSPTILRPEEEEEKTCGESGEKVSTERSGDVCVYRRQKIVVETGFSCPKWVPYRFDKNRYVVCAATEDLGQLTFDEIETEAFDGELDDGDGWTVNQQVDLLWVVDNSMSMCEEQQELRSNFRKMASILKRRGLDFHMAVTTTQMTETPFEKVAEPGRLQSTPYPPVGTAKACRFKGPDKQGERDYQPLRSQIRAAVRCTKNPSQFDALKQWSNTELRCALFDEPEGSEQNDDANHCESAGKNDSFSVEQLFPCGNQFGEDCDKSQLDQVYRDIPKVLRAEDYRTDDGTFETEKLERDFACMSYVGTRGSSVEQGMRAAVKAVSPSMTGGPPTSPTDTSAPNHGFLRRDASFVVTFVSDENDCSHSGDAIEQRKGQNACGELNCYFPTKSDPQDPLTSTEKLKEQLLSNLAASKDVDEVKEDDVLVSTITGFSRRYSQSIPSMCSTEQLRNLRSNLRVCNTSLGSAKSGDRYADFAESFPYRVPDDPSTRGMMCSGNLEAPLVDIAEYVQ